MFASSLQQDADEFLRALLDKLEAELTPLCKAAEGDFVNPINANFAFTVEHVLTCASAACKHVSITTELARDLSCMLPKESEHI